jgi:hypothetical protein
MTNVTVGICGILYLATSLGFFYKKQWSWALTYFAYALANVGLIMAAMETTK